MKFSRALARQLIAKYQRRLGLESWEIRLRISGKMASTVQAEVSVMTEYLDAQIKLNPTVSLADLESVICHEMVHLLTWPLWEEAEDACRAAGILANRAAAEHERLVTRLQRLLMA